jgi:hypothetical protein
VFCDYGKNYRLQDIQLRKIIVKFREPDFCDDHCRRKLARAAHARITALRSLEKL